MNRKIENILRVGSFYTGYGGGEWALKKAGIDFKVIYYSEIKPAAIKIYEHNFGKHNNMGDITNINPNDLEDVDLIIGGFPCQDVSIAGLRDLSQGRTNTVFKLLEIIKVKKPKYVLLENVQGILSLLDGDLIKEIVRQLKSYGYAVCYDLLYSKDYGVPQNRPRVWIAAELGRSSFMFNPFPKKEELKIFVKDLICKNVQDKYYLTKHQIEYAIKYAKSRSRGELNINPTILSTMLGRHPKRACHEASLIKDKKGLRILTPKESFLFQGFDKNLIKFGNLSDSALYDLAGNGWDINLVSKIFKKWIK